jgi:hypothetical protein
LLHPLLRLEDSRHYTKIDIYPVKGLRGDTLMSCNCRSMKTNTAFSLIVAISLALTGGAFAAGYQIKGKVAKVGKSTFTVDTGTQKMEIARDANTKVKGDLAVGAEVTVKYMMHATSVDSKAAAPAASPAAKASPAKPAKPMKAQKKEGS